MIPFSQTIPFYRRLRKLKGDRISKRRLRNRSFRMWKNRLLFAGKSIFITFVIGTAQGIGFDRKKCLPPIRIKFFLPVNRVKILNPLGKDRKSTRLNSSHVAISYAVFCLKKK